MNDLNTMKDELANFDFARISRTLDEYGSTLDKIGYLHTYFHSRPDKTYTGEEVATILREDLMGVKS